MYLTKCPECSGDLCMSHAKLYFNYGHVPIDPEVGYKFNVTDDVVEAEDETAVCPQCETEFDLNTELWVEPDYESEIAKDNPEFLLVLSDEPDWERCKKIAREISELEVKTTGGALVDFLDYALTEESLFQVIQIFAKHGATLTDFHELDNSPGHFGGYKIDGREWHYKVRQVRNRSYKALAVALYKATKDDKGND